MSERSPVLLVHSGGFTSRQWRRLGADLSPDHDVVMPDLIGYGKEPAWPVGTPFHFRQDVDRLAAMLDSRPTHLVGHSYGGLIVMQLALARPEIVRSIAVFEPVTMGILTDDDLDAHAALARMPRYVLGPEVDEVWLATFVDWWNGPGAWGKLAPETQQAFREVAWKLSEEVATLIADRTDAARYGTITAPTLLLGGANSQPAEHRVLERLAAALPNARLTMFPEMGHMGPITHAAQVNTAIAAHVRAR